MAPRSVVSRRKKMKPAATTGRPGQKKPYVLKAIRFPSLTLVDWVAEAAAIKVGEGRGAWGEFISRAALHLARLTLKGKLSPKQHFLPRHHIPRAVESEETLRTNVALPVDYLPFIEEAARRLNHHVSPFLSWASLVEAQRILDYYPDVSPRETVVGEVSSRDGEEYTTMAIRFPLRAIKRMDKVCVGYGVSRSKFLREAVYYTIQKRIVKAGKIDLLPSSHSLNGGKKMVSFKLPTSLRNDADAAGAVMNHNSTGFLVFASLVFLDSEQA